MSSKLSSSPNFCCSFYISKKCKPSEFKPALNFRPGLNSDDAKVILMIKEPITVSKSYARDGAGRERKKERRRERVNVSSLHMDIKLCFLVPYIHYQVMKENSFGCMLEI